MKNALAKSQIGIGASRRRRGQKLIRIVDMKQRLLKTRGKKEEGQRKRTLRTSNSGRYKQHHGEGGTESLKGGGATFMPLFRRWGREKNEHKDEEKARIQKIGSVGDEYGL